MLDVTSPTMDPRAAAIPPETFWARVMVRPGCWLWDGFTSRSGYGQLSIKVDGVPHTIQAHRISYEWHVGPVPVGQTIDHLCRTRECVRPDHLEAVTATCNVQRGLDFSTGRRRQRRQWAALLGDTTPDPLPLLLEDITA